VYRLLLSSHRAATLTPVLRISCNCRFGIVVATVAPGFVSTDRVGWKLSAPGVGDSIRAQSSWGRVATPDEVAEAVAFAAAYWRVPWVTGAVIDLNGASYLRM
jgi:3-oxoacyl-[acyl-carrier protein] reductase